jgi:hypothetical protein
MIDDDEYGAVGAMIVSGNRNTGRNPAPVPLCPLQINPGRRDRKPATNRLSYPFRLTGSLYRVFQKELYNF